MATTKFNPEELIFHKVRQVNAYDISDGKLLYMLSHVKDPSLETTADKEDVTDESDNIISSIYKAKTATFSGTNALIHLGLWAAQSGDTKHLLGVGEQSRQYSLSTLAVPTFEIVSPSAIEDNKATLNVNGHTSSMYSTPKYIYRIKGSGINDVIPLLAEAPTDKTTVGYVMGASRYDQFVVYNLSDVTTEDEFYVEYDTNVKSTTPAAYFDNFADKFPTQCGLKIFAYFLDPCDNNVVYSGVIVADRAQLNPESFTLDLNPTNGHQFEYTIQKPYCDNSDDARLYRVIITDKRETDTEVSNTTSASSSTTG